MLTPHLCARFYALCLTAMVVVGCAARDEDLKNNRSTVRVTINPGENVGYIEGADPDDPAARIYFENVGGKAVVDGDIGLGNIEELPAIFENARIPTNSRSAPERRGLHLRSSISRNSLQKRSSQPHWKADMSR